MSKTRGSVMEEVLIVLALIALVVLAYVLGHLAVRAFLNLLVGGTLFGGNLL